jgi:hypothetical protein
VIEFVTMSHEELTDGYHLWSLRLSQEKPSVVLILLVIAVTPFL